MPDAQIDAIEQVEWMSFGDSPISWRRVPQGARAPEMQGHRHIAGASLATHALNNGLLAKPCRGLAHGPRTHNGIIIPSISR